MSSFAIPVPISPSDRIPTLILSPMIVNQVAYSITCCVAFVLELDVIVSCPLTGVSGDAKEGLNGITSD
jgi:hypothetical protein